MGLRDEVISGSIAKISQVVLGAGGSLWLAWKLGPSGLGVYAVIISISFIVSRPVNGLSESTKHRASAGRDLGRMTGLALGASLLWGFAVFLPITIIESILVALAIVSYTIYSPTQTLGTVIDVGTQTWFSAIRIGVTVLGQVGSFLLIGPSIELAIWWYIIGNAVGLLLNIYLIGERPRFPTRTDIESVKDYAQHSIVSTLAGEITDRADILLLGFLIGSASAGQYEVAWRISLPVIFVATLTGSGHMRDVASGATSDELAPLDFVSVTAIPFVIGAVLIGQDVLGIIFGEVYRKAWPLLVGLGLFQVFRSQAVIRRAIINGRDQPEVVKRVNILTLVINVLLGVFLIEFIGAVGVVIATVLTEFGQLGIYARITGGPYITQGVKEQLVATIGMGAVLGPFVWWSSPTNLLYLSLYVGIGVIAYGTILLFTPRHRQLISEIII